MSKSLKDILKIMMSMVLGKEAKKRRKQKYMQQQQMLGNP
jgi:hypothetical protein